MLIFRTTLSSPVPSAVRDLKVADELKIRKEDQRGPVTAITAGGLTAGSITSARLLQLMKCIDEGHVYVGIVKRAEKGQVELEIRPRSNK